jgi:uncharacterized protein (UPF0332 family)
MDGRDLIAVAGHLTQNSALGNAEARYRSAVSRAYYGAFHLVAQLLREHGREVKRSHIGHEDAYRTLLGTNVPDAATAARHLTTLRTDRIKADYQLSAGGFDSQVAAMARVELAETIRSLLDKCRQNPGFAVALKDA